MYLIDLGFILIALIWPMKKMTKTSHIVQLIYLNFAQAFCVWSGANYTSLESSSIKDSNGSSRSQIGVEIVELWRKEGWLRELWAKAATLDAPEWAKV